MSSAIVEMLPVMISVMATEQNDEDEKLTSSSRRKFSVPLPQWQEDSSEDELSTVPLPQWQEDSSDDEFCQRSPSSAPLSPWNEDSSSDEFCHRHRSSSSNSSNASTSARDEAGSTNDDTTSSSGAPSSKPRWADEDTDDDITLRTTSTDAQSSKPRWADYESDDEPVNPETCRSPTPMAKTRAGLKLNSWAREFVPGVQATVCGASAPTFSLEARRGFGSIVAAGLGALRSSNLVGHAEVHEGACGWSLYCTARCDDWAAVDTVQTIIEELQRVLFHAAASSDNTYVVGYDTAPFAPIFGKFGFSTNLAYVRDANKACWDFVTTGHCGRGHACRWQHPAEQVVLEVVIDM